MHRPVKLAILLAIATIGFGARADAEEKLCDASVENCRIPLIALIKNERVGIDVGV